MEDEPQVFVPHGDHTWLPATVVQVADGRELEYRVEAETGGFEGKGSAITTSTTRPQLTIPTATTLLTHRLPHLPHLQLLTSVSTRPRRINLTSTACLHRPTSAASVRHLHRRRH